MTGKDFKDSKDRYERVSKKTETMKKKARDDGIEIQESVKDNLRNASSHHIEADRKSTAGNIDEAVKEQDKAIDYLDQAFFEVARLYLEEPYQKVCAARASYSGYDYLAGRYIQNYDIHERCFSEIRELMEGDKSSSEKLSADDVVRFKGYLQNFLRDFGIGKKRLFSEKKEKEEEKKERKRMFRIGMIVTFVAAVLGGVIGSIIREKTSSQPPAQPESVVSEAETPNP